MYLCILYGKKKCERGEVRWKIATVGEREDWKIPQVKNGKNGKELQEKIKKK